MYSDRQISFEKLNELFVAFGGASAKLQESYDKLEGRVAYLTKELEEKNLILEQHVLELDQMQKYLHNVLEHISDGVIALKLNGTIAAFNKAAQNITRFSATEVIGKRYEEIFLPKEVGDDFIENIIQGKTLLSGQETTIQNKSGDLIPIIAYTAFITDEQGEVSGIVITFNDLSKIKQLEDEVDRAKRLAALGEMAAGVAHEIRNPLGGIEMFASILERECKDDERKHAIAQNIIHGVRSLDKIISQLLTFTRSFGRTDYGPIDILDCLESSVSFACQELFEKQITVKKDYTISKSVMVVGDRDQLQQVLLNLLLNAAQAIEHSSGIIKIRCLPFAQQGYVAIDITDNGCGIKKECLKKIFDPFFTTKPKGTGLGLAISYRIIEAHGGKISVHSQEQQGTRFSMMLPLRKGV